MKAHLIRRGKQYAVKFFDEENQRWSHLSLKTSKKAIADLRFGTFLKDRQKTELLGELKVQPIKLKDLVKEFLSYMEAKRSTRYAKLRQILVLACRILALLVLVLAVAVALGGYYTCYHCATAPTRAMLSGPN